VAAARTFADTALVLLSGARIARYAKCCHWNIQMAGGRRSM